MKLRDKDRMQFFAGIVRANRDTDQAECLLGKIDRGGNPLQFAYLKNSYSVGEISECYALTLTEQDQVIAVGKISDGTRTSALIILSDDLLTTTLIKQWSVSSTDYDKTPY